MTLKEVYEQLDGDYNDITSRLGENMLLRLVGILVKDSSYKDICTALEQQDYETAFRAAHTLKGVALNMSLPLLAEKASELTEILRNRQYNDDIQPALAELTPIYQKIHHTFSEFLNSSSSRDLE